MVMKGGCVQASGDPAKVLTADLVHQTFGLACRVIDDPESHTPLVIPKFTG